MSGEASLGKTFGFSNYEGTCRGPVGGECGRELTLVIRMESALDPRKRMRCRECDTCNTLKRVVA